MHREKLTFLLNRYHPAHAEEIAFKSEMLQFIARHEDCFERSLQIGHITASSWLLSKECTKALLMHHTKLDRWVQLGGHCDGNPDVLQVAIKEAQEESGIAQIRPVFNEIFDIDIHLIPAKGQISAHHHFDVRFLLEVASGESVIRNGESKELRWIGKNESELPTDSPSVVRMFTKWLNAHNNLAK
jgi:8-oxo-dGTP pyrophosphatase MutT (NUDIX family)